MTRADGDLTPTRAAIAQMRFHLGGGVRLALRAGVPLAAVVTVAVGISPDPGATVVALAEGAAVAGRSTGVVWLLTAVSLLLAIWAAPRLAHGADGWARHLPISAAAQRRGIQLALVVCQAPATITWIVLWSVAARHGLPVDPMRLATPFLVACACAVAVTPVRRRSTAIGTGAVALVGAVLDSWSGPFLALAAVVIGDRIQGPIGRRRRRLAPRRVEVTSALGLQLRIACRALGTTGFLRGWVFAAVPLAAAAAFAAHNPESPRVGAVRFGGALAITVLAADLAHRLARRRPPWGWVRSLPWSALHRVSADAVLFALACIPPIVAVAAIRPAAALPLAATVPLIALAAADAARTPPAGHGGAWAPVLGLGTFVALWLGVLSATAMLALLLAIPKLLEAARGERAHKVAAWEPRHHAAVGDPGSWRG